MEIVHIGPMQAYLFQQHAESAWKLAGRGMSLQEANHLSFCGEFDYNWGQEAEGLYAYHTDAYRQKQKMIGRSYHNLLCYHLNPWGIEKKRRYT